MLCHEFKDNHNTPTETDSRHPDRLGLNIRKKYLSRLDNAYRILSNEDVRKEMSII